MGILSGVRATDTSVLNTLRDPRFWEPYLGAVHTQSGISVSPSRALSLSTYFTCVTGISADIAKLPMCIKRILPDGRMEMDLENANRTVLIHRPNFLMTGRTFWEVMMSHALTWGNAYAQIRRDMNDNIVDFILQHPSLVDIRDTDTGGIIYHVRPIRGNPIDLMPQEVFHLKGPSDDGIKGLSVCQLASQSIGLALAAEKFGASLFGNGQVPRIAVTLPTVFNEEKAAEFRREWAARHQDPEHWLSPALLQPGMDIKSLSIPPEDAQMLETRAFSVKEICRWFHYPVEKCGDKSDSPYNTSESANKSYVDDALTPWTTRINAETQSKVFNAFDTCLAWNFRELLRGDSEKRAEYYSKLQGPAGLTANEIRDDEGWPHIGKEGDFNYVGGNMAVVTKDGPKYPQKSLDNRSGADPSPEKEDSGGTDKASLATAFAPLVSEVFGRAWTRITKDCMGGKNHDDVRAAQTERIGKALTPILSAIATITKSEPLNISRITRDVLEKTAFPTEQTEAAFKESQSAFVLSATQITMKEALHE